MSKYLKIFKNQADYLDNYNELSFPNVSFISDNESVILAETKRTVIDIKKAKTRHRNSKFSVGDVFIYDKGNSKFSVHSYENIQTAIDNGEITSLANIHVYGICVIPDNFLSQDLSYMNSLARFITTTNLNDGARYLWDQPVMNYSGYGAKNGLISEYNTMYGYPILNNHKELQIMDVPTRYELVAHLPFDDGIFRNAPYVVSTKYNIENYVDPGLHWDYSCIINKKSGLVEENIPISLDFAPSPYKLMEDGTYELNPEFDKTTDYTEGILCNGKPLSNGIVPNPFLDTLGIMDTYHLHELNVKNGNTDFEAAEMCYNFNAMYNRDGVDYKGWFYIPSAGESAFIIARINKINNILKKITNSCLFSWGGQIGDARDPETGEIKHQSDYAPTWYWTSTQANANRAHILNTFSIDANEDGDCETLFGGSLGPAFKFDTVLRVRPFFMIRPNYEIGDSMKILRVNDNYPDGQLVYLPTFGATS